MFVLLILALLIVDLIPIYDSYGAKTEAMIDVVIEGFDEQMRYTCHDSIARNVCIRGSRDVLDAPPLLP